jgi:hypothetical protein
MDGPTTGALVFGCLFAAGLGGMYLRDHLPESSLGQGTVVLLRRMVTALTLMAAVMLGFTTVSMKSSFDAADRDVRHLSVQITELDRALRRIGPEAAPIRDLLFRYAGRAGWVGGTAGAIARRARSLAGNRSGEGPGHFRGPGYPARYRGDASDDL